MTQGSGYPSDIDDLDFDCGTSKTFLNPSKEEEPKEVTFFTFFKKTEHNFKRGN